SERPPHPDRRRGASRPDARLRRAAAGFADIEVGGSAPDTPAGAGGEVAEPGGELFENAAPVAKAPPVSAPAPVEDRRERLDRIRRRVTEAAKPAARIEPVPADPARAAESVLALVRDLESELASAREREEALRGDLDESRRELARAAGEARAASERLSESERQLEEKRAVLSDLLAEMNALEAERDEAVRRAQALVAVDEERSRTLEEVTLRADEEAKLRAEREAEVERLSEELRNGAADAARLRAALAEVTRDRDAVGADLDRVTHERDELAAAKRALEQVHAALAQARARLG
ncbi:MAG TPA: hypothetical protein VD838_13840, partial [Anaeromyxobacteraceae bacterium]|nr:hypothetical protein [Anaeromyxobacteraceae bacterium]